MSFLEEDEPSPWGTQANFDTDQSPWGANSDREQEESDVEADETADFDPYSNAPPQVQEEDILGSAKPAQGLEFQQRSTPTPEAPTMKRSPARRSRHAKIKKAVVQTESIDAGPLIPATPAAVTEESPTELAPKLESVSLAEPASDREEASRESESEDEPMKLAGRLEVQVGDPSKVGDITSTHIIYTVNTSTDLPQYPTADEGVFSVTRRYRDFRWLYKALVSNQPGCVVPPPPEKQVFGTLNNDFVESRRAALENMVTKIANHPTLRVDPDLVAFLTHTDFTEYLKTRVISDEELEAASTGTGIFGLSVFSKSDEVDSWLVEKRNELDGLELQLKSLAKAFDVLHQQRNDFSTSLAEFASVTTALADAEPTRSVENLLREFAKVHNRLGELYQRQQQQDTLFIEATVDEQVRLVNSVRDACNAKQRLQAAAVSARSDATKREQQLDKLYKQNSDKVQAAEADARVFIEKAESAERAYSVAAQRVGSELSRVEREKIQDFRNAVELYLENAIESQKQSIEIWETFYSRYFMSKE